jgi:hypothetical protein
MPAIQQALSNLALVVSEETQMADEGNELVDDVRDSSSGQLHGSHGYFLPGHVKLGGRQPKSRTFREIAALLPDDEKEAIVKAIANKAKAGNVAAFEKIADRAEGKPAVTVHADMPDPQSGFVVWLEQVRQQLGIAPPADEQDGSSDT